jgi:hypothetical protein
MQSQVGWQEFPAWPALYSVEQEDHAPGSV